VIEDVEMIRGRFSRDGYLVVPAVVDETDVCSIRQLAEQKRAETGRQEMYASEFFSNQLLATLPARPPMMRVLRALIGQPMWLYPNATVRQDWLTPWHRDGGFISLDRRAEGILYLQCGLYCQGNDGENGGGLDVVAGSHRAAFSVLEWKKSRSPSPLTVIASAGDAVIWDARLIHRSSKRRGNWSASRIAVFWTCARRDVDPATFLNHLEARSRSDADEDMRSRYANIASLRDSKYIQSDAFEALVSQGYRFATLSG